MRKILKIVLLTLQSALIFIFIGATSYAITKNTQKIFLVEEFKSKGIFDEENSTETLKFFRIESEEKKVAFRKYNDQIYVTAPVEFYAQWVKQEDNKEIVIAYGDVNLNNIIASSSRNL